MRVCVGLCEPVVEYFSTLMRSIDLKIVRVCAGGANARPTAGGNPSTRTTTSLGRNLYSDSNWWGLGHNAHVPYVRWSSTATATIFVHRNWRSQDGRVVGETRARRVGAETETGAREVRMATPPEGVVPCWHRPRRGVLSQRNEERVQAIYNMVVGWRLGVGCTGGYHSRGCCAAAGASCSSSSSSSSGTVPSELVIDDAGLNARNVLRSARGTRLLSLEVEERSVMSSVLGAFFSGDRGVWSVLR